LVCLYTVTNYEEDDEQTTAMNFDSEGADTAKDTTFNKTLQVMVRRSVSNSVIHTVVEHYAMELFST
jgi:hypothetical protein